MRLRLFAVKAIAILTIKCAHGTEKWSSPILSPVLAIFSTGHKECVGELCALPDLHVKCILLAA